MQPITVIKRDHRGQHVTQYQGDVIARGPAWVCLRARFDRGDVDSGALVFRRGDVMTEWFYADRWYSVFQITGVDDGRNKGWYCNLSRPAEITETSVAADDLALDVFVTPERKIVLLDEDEFAAISLPEEEVEAVRQAVAEIGSLVEAASAPFDL